MSYSFLLNSSVENPLTTNESSNLLPDVNPDDHLLLQAIVNKGNKHLLVDPNFLPLPCNDNLSSQQEEIIESDSVFFLDDIDSDTSDDTSTESLTYTLPPFVDQCDNISFSSSHQIETDIVSLEAYLDDNIFDDELSTRSAPLEDRNIYAQGLNVKELLQILSEEQMPLHYKSQIKKLHPVKGL